MFMVNLISFPPLGFRDPRASFMPMERGNRHIEEADQDGEVPQKDYYVSAFMLRT